MKMTSISVSEKTKNRIASLGQKSETYDKIINRLLDMLEAELRK